MRKIKAKDVKVGDCVWVKWKRKKDDGGDLMIVTGITKSGEYLDFIHKQESLYTPDKIDKFEMTFDKNTYSEDNDTTADFYLLNEDEKMKYYTKPLSLEKLKQGNKKE